METVLEVMEKKIIYIHIFDQGLKQPNEAIKLFFHKA